MQHFGTADSVFHASLTELEAIGLMAVSAQSIATGASLQKGPEEQMGKASEAGANIVTAMPIQSIPTRLLEIYDPPLFLYVRGDVELLSQPGIAVVGTPPSYALRIRYGRTALM